MYVQVTEEARNQIHHSLLPLALAGDIKISQL